MLAFDKFKDTHISMQLFLFIVTLYRIKKVLAFLKFSTLLKNVIEISCNFCAINYVLTFIMKVTVIIANAY